MNTFLRFFYEFVSIFFDGVIEVFKGIINGVIQMFNYYDYKEIISNYKGSFKGIEWLFVGLAVAIFVLILVAILLLIFFGIRKILSFRKRKLDQDELLDEIGKLNNQVRDLMQEKKELMAMKVSQLGLNPNEEENSNDNPENPEEKPEEVKPENKPGDSTKPGKGELPNTGGVNSVYPILIGLLVAGSGFGVIKKKKENDIA